MVSENDQSDLDEKIDMWAKCEIALIEIDIMLREWREFLERHRTAMAS